MNKSEFSERDEQFMKRALHLASLADYKIRFNPKVGAVIVHGERIIGEGFHQVYGEGHAEVNALKSVSKTDLSLLPESEMYVTLEPCNHHGKTPPCVEAIIDSGIKNVTICKLDPNRRMNGKSVQLLEQRGINVRTGLLENECEHLNSLFEHNLESPAPYIILKWAQTKNGKFGLEEKSMWFTNDQSKFLVHRWRGEIDGIMVGTDTARLDNPLLTNRMTSGRSPVRFVLDRQGRLPSNLKMFHDSGMTHVFTAHQDGLYQYPENVQVHIINPWSLIQIMTKCKEIGCASLLIEGGASLLKSVIKQGLWNEARIFKTDQILEEGIKAPLIRGHVVKKHHLNNDKLFIISNLHSKFNHKII